MNNIRNADEIIDQVCEATSRWAEIAKECDVPQNMIDIIKPNLLLKL